MNRTRWELLLPRQLAGSDPSGQSVRVPDAGPTIAARVAKVVLVLVLGCGVAVAVIFAGPKETIVCDDATWPSSLFGDTFGHTDGAAFTGCDVPTSATWAVAAASILVPTALVITADLRQRDRTSD